jgi:hypothetical protein
MCKSLQDVVAELDRQASEHARAMKTEKDNATQQRYNGVLIGLTLARKSVNELIRHERESCGKS